MMEEEDDLSINYKLCGYILPIVSVSSSQTPIPFLTPCTLAFGREKLGFQTMNGDLLLPIERDSGLLSSKKKKRSRDGGDAVYQLFGLLSNKCLRIKCRVLKGFSGKIYDRVVLLVDIYLPIEVWHDGWQFPNLGALAGAFFKHVSCDWQARNSLLCLDNNGDTHPLMNENHIWNIPDCHLLGCPLHSFVPNANDNGIFDLHKILKTLPTLEKTEDTIYTQIIPVDPSIGPGIWDLADDILTKVLVTLSPKDLVSISSTCHHFRALASSVVPCMKLKLFPHQVAAVEWMWKREHNVKSMPHPLYTLFVTNDGFSFHINILSGEICSGTAPIIKDFRGGLFCDEPGLGKTITSLSVILKTHRALAYPPEGVEVVWCMHDDDRKCGYYEINSGTPGKSISNQERFIGQNVRKEDSSYRNSLSEINYVESSNVSDRQCKSMPPKLTSHSTSSTGSSNKSPTFMQTSRLLNFTRNLDWGKRNLLDAFEEVKSHECRKRKLLECSTSTTQNVDHQTLKKYNIGSSKAYETWIRCDACKKWRKLSDMSVLDTNVAWFCSMNIDPLYQKCAVPEETWNYMRNITHFPGFYTKGTQQGKDENVFFFTNVLIEHSTLINFKTVEALKWLANLSSSQLLEMETRGLFRPGFLDRRFVPEGNFPSYHKIFRSFGLVRKLERRTVRWFYPSNLYNLEFDLSALKIALTRPLDVFRLYLSGATLIVVPANLVEHWKTQIQKHVKQGQLRVYVWNDNNKPFGAHNLAWDYDIVITTFSKLSVEWKLHKNSMLMQVHWLRIILDEGHTLGSSLSLTNKLQMAISLVSTNRWILTGTPTPYTPTNQVSHLQPMLNFLHEEVYGQNRKTWENGILKPFEAEKNEGRLLLLTLLSRIMISARKENLKSIPPCIKKVTFVDFNVEHAKSYNELVVTVRRNILMADWNDPSHVESLLNPKQWKFRSNTIKNVRLSCCVAGHIKVTEAGQDIQETMEIFVGQGLDPLSDEYSFILSSLLHGCSCFRCKEWCRLPLITPCRHFLCLDCVSLDSEKCTYPGCGYQYEMQSPEILRRSENPNPKWPVPKDLIELQPSYEQNNWEPDWQSTSSSKVTYLVEKLKNLQDSNIKSGYFEESSDCNRHILYSQKMNSTGNDSSSNGQSCMHDKVIVFSQFLEHINVIEQQLTIAGIKYAGMYSPMHSINKMKSLQLFRHDPTCMVLLMDGSAALGLDLSFVTHVFLMEPIWDRSMEEQVISRAHRMGATRPIYVETLAMRGTIEQQMLEFLQNASTSRRVLNQEIDVATNVGGKTHRNVHDFAENSYLHHLSFVRC